MRLSVRSSRLPALFLVACSLITALPAASTRPTSVSPSLSSELAPALQRVPGLDAQDKSALISTLGATRQSKGMLMDTAAVSAFPHVPTALDAPLSISRIQSAYRAADAISGALVVTFTVTNNLSPAITSTIPTSDTTAATGTASVTDTAALSAALDLSNDPHTIHNVLIRDALVSPAGYTGADPTPDRTGGEIVWNLGDIEPLQSVTASVTVTVPSSSAAFTTLDAGAGTWGMLEGRAVNAQARPASLAPDNVSDGPTGDWLRSTIDADTTDQYMLAQAGLVIQDPLREFTYVQGLGYDAYKGSLRGTRGTLWSQAGNSLDKASLLIAMLRASGLPARYRHGTLSVPLAQRLILSMFPTPTQLRGHISVGTQLADPANDPTLLAETRDHWWVEAYVLDKGWQDLDPSFSDAAVGQRYVADGDISTDGTDRVAEVPDVLRDKVTLSVKVETLTPTAFSLAPLVESYPLTHTFNAVELVGVPVTLAHLVSTYAPHGLIFSVVQHTYTPYFHVGGTIIQGQSFDDLISNFPFAQKPITGEWLEYDVRDADGRTQHYERTVKDVVGFAARQGGDASVAVGTGTAPFVTAQDVVTTLFAPGQVSEIAVNKQIRASGLTLQHALAVDNADGSSDPNSPIGLDANQSLKNATANFLENELAADCLRYYDGYDAAATTIGATLLAHVYADSPRIVTAASVVSGTDGVSPTVNLSMDVENNSVTPVVGPGQDAKAARVINKMIGVFSGTEEDIVMSSANPDQPNLSVATAFQEARQEGIGTTEIDTAHIDRLTHLSLSPEAKARMTRDIEKGFIIITPDAMVRIGNTVTVGWYTIDPHTGFVTDTMENGQHQDEVEYSELIANIESGIISPSSKTSSRNFLRKSWTICVSPAPRSVPMSWRHWPPRATTYSTMIKVMT